MVLRRRSPVRGRPGGPIADLPTRVDANGTQREDFADIVLYINQMSWIAANEPVEGFDYNFNDRVDFADAVPALA